MGCQHNQRRMNQEPGKRAHVEGGEVGPLKRETPVELMDNSIGRRL